MRATFILAGAAVLLSGCAHEGVKVRQVGAVHADASDGTTSGRVAIGLSYLAMNNVGLALENFRRAAREDPSSAEALAGMAECYQRIGRTALARQYLEQALALRPQESGLYRALAVVSDAEGKGQEAVALRREADLRAAGKTAAAQRVTVALPEPIKATAAPAQSVTVRLAPARPAADAGPRLVRMSMGEVMLVSTTRSPFGEVRSAQADIIHAPLRVLNAARIQGIAARTRTLLASKGLTGIEIGNAPGRRPTSELRHAQADRARAQEVARRLPYAVRLVERAGPMVLLLGRDAGLGA